jgi:hypothetical protein
LGSFCSSYPKYNFQLFFPRHNATCNRRGLSLKVSDEFTVPLRAIHHRQIHTTGKEREWWEERNIDPLIVASRLWQQSRGLYLEPGKVNLPELLEDRVNGHQGIRQASDDYSRPGMIAAGTRDQIAEANSKSSETVLVGARHALHPCSPLTRLAWCSQYLN